MNNVKGNYHTHTYRCHHATMDADESYVLSAIEEGITDLAFTDHAPVESKYYPLQYNDRMTVDEMEDYLNSIQTLKEKYKDKINIYVGFEAEFFPDRLEFYKMLRSKSDLLILGQHFSECMKADYADDCSSEKLKLLESQMEGAIKSGLFSYLAHPDYFMLGRKTWDKDCEHLARRIAEMAVEYNLPLEINLGGMKYGEKEIDGEMVIAYPYKKFWDIMQEYPVKAIYGYDAHDPKVLKETWRMDKVKKYIGELKLEIIDHIDL